MQTHPVATIPPTPQLVGVAPTRTQRRLIALMWALSLLVPVLGILYNALFSPAILLLELPSIAIALVLLFKAGSVNKWNGGIKVAIDILFAAFLFLFYFVFRVIDVPPHSG